MATTGRHLAATARSASAAIQVFRDHAIGEILPIYNNLEGRANQMMEDEFARLGAEPVFEDFNVDMADLAELAHDAGLAFYETMRNLRQTTLNLLAAGLFHLVEQQVASLLHDRAFESTKLPDDFNLRNIAGWSAKYLALDLWSLPSSRPVDELRLVANVIKHAEGPSASQLRERRPELFYLPELEFLRLESGQHLSMFRKVRDPLAGDDLFVTEGILNEYARAAESLLSGIAAYFGEHADESYPLIVDAAPGGV